MKAEELRVIAQRYGDRGLEGAEVGQILRGELGGAPRLDLGVATAILIGWRQPERTEGCGVGIPQDDRTAAAAQPRRDLVRLGTDGRDIAQTAQLIDPRSTQVGEHGVQRGKVCVEVSDDRDGHAHSFLST